MGNVCIASRKSADQVPATEFKDDETTYPKISDPNVYTIALLQS